LAEGPTKEIMAFPENSQWRRRRDVSPQGVPQKWSGDRKSPIAIIIAKRKRLFCTKTRPVSKQFN